MLFFIPQNSLPAIAPGLTVHIEFRERAERRDDNDFFASLNDNRATLFTRGRVGLAYDAGEGTTLRAVYQYDNAQTMPTVGGDSQATRQDLVEANLQHRSRGSIFTVGRQKTSKGGQRLIGALEWANSSRSWLGARLQAGGWDMFYGELESNPVPNPDVKLAYASYDGPLGESLVAYKFDDRIVPRTSVTTIDDRCEHKIGNVALTGEAAYQWGRKSGLDLEAWAATLRATVVASPSVSIFVEGNVATGGSSSTVTRTFDNLYPTNHLYYGMMDLQGWSNMKGVAVGANWRATSRLGIEASFHSFSLYDKKDGWYGAAGGINKRGLVAYIDPSGASGDSIGSEFDIVGKYRISSNQSIEGGFGIFRPGGFVKSFVGGSIEESTWGYLQFGTKF